MNAINDRTGDRISSCIAVKIQLKRHTALENTTKIHMAKLKHHGRQERLSCDPHSFHDIYEWHCVCQGSSVHSRRTGTIDTGWCSKMDVPKGIRHTRTRRQPNSSSILIAPLLEEGDLILHAESFNAVECNQWARKPDKIYWGEHTDKKSEKRKAEKTGLVPMLDVPLDACWV